jgi:RNA polymerase sigma-70 factor (ECF subfamily)
VASFVEVHGQAGDEGNFEALYRTYKSEVQRLASYLLKNRDDAEDASQTVFMNVLRALREGVKPADPRAWLLAITRNVCFSRKRAVACRLDEVELDPETVGDAGGNGDGGPSADDIVGALARLLPNQRTALILRDFRGVPRAEISELLAISPTGVEALLTRARSSFREELEADAQPFDCAETRALVEQQLDGAITVAERHSLRAHLRHCSPCSTLARAVRSSRGKLASLLFWPADLISRLASACSQAPSAVHLAGAISSAAVVASVAIPVAIHYVPAAPHVEGRTAPASVASLHQGSSRVTSVVSARRSGPQAPTQTTRAHKPATHARTHTHARAHAPVHVHTVRSASHSAAATTTGWTSAEPAATAKLTSAQPASAQPSTAWQPVAIAPRSSSPAWRAHVKGKPKSAYRAPVRRGSKRHAPMPPDEIGASAPPAATFLPAGGDNGSGPAFSKGTSAASAGDSAVPHPAGSASAKARDKH